MPQLNTDGRRSVSFILNGKPVTGHAEPRMLLTDFLRQEMGLSEIHVGCEHGVCGTCTIRMDGRPARACLTFAVQAEGHRIDTVQSLATPEGALNDLQLAFRKHHALQCGYCTPGILMSVTAFLEINAEPSDAEVRDMLSGHLCRCTGYVGMVHAILDVAKSRRKKAGSTATA
ncbi:MAG: (2Fe-2S)-binding protein [Betaproteobacteria bacterium RBG_16_64_18]|nr:MAG: (2Fe-2S)-binding protein [Betaproteobacteria bacterium RBG_16_64_18]OGA10044.1 MAG: (2Fe-2S)-binding protein [Betaproteobacteria bacterium RIFCSPLOWO2_02_FULL_65_20]